MKKVILLCLLNLAYFANSFAQNNPTIKIVQVNFTPVVNPNNPIDTLVKINCVLSFESNSNINSISRFHINVGIQDGGTDIFQYQFPRNPNSLPADMQYSENGNLITLTLGNFHVTGDYYYEAKLEYSNGSISSPKKYHFQ